MFQFVSFPHAIANRPGSQVDVCDHERLAAIAAHELREPVHAVLSLLNVVLKEQVGSLTDVQRDFLFTADNAARRLKRRIEDVQLILRGGDGFSLDLQPTDLVERVNECCHELGEIANSYSVEIKTNVCVARSAWILADPARIDQILLNLIENAIQYASSQSQVYVTVRSSTSGAWCVEVENIVDEIPNDDLSSWFQAFKRGNCEKTTAREGLGLGLTAVNYLVHAQDGDVEVHSFGNRVCFGVKFAKLGEWCTAAD